MADMDRFREYKPGIIGLNEINNSAVCIPVVQTEAGEGILFEVRASHIPDQPGDICLPGGRIESGESPEEAAVRECAEELLIEPCQVELIGPSDIFHTENVIVYPYVVRLKDYNGTFSRHEVAEVFSVPVSFFLENEPERHRVNAVVVPDEGFPYERIAGGRNYKWRARYTDQLFYQYGEYTIWGLTAKVINAFAELIR